MNIYNAKHRVVEYYENTIFDYFTVYFRNRNYSMNYGYWDDTVRNRSQSLYRLYEKINEKLEIKNKNKLLDAGCGLGEASCWFASQINCSCIGITIAPSQVVKANQIAENRGLSEKVIFFEMDYTQMTFQANSFDAVIAIETINHLVNKEDFYKEVFRVLKPGGKLVVAEYTLFREPKTETEARQMSKFLSGWEMPNLWSVQQHKKSLQNVGFTKIESEDYSNKTTKTSRYLYLYSIPGLPIYWFFQKIGLMNKYQLGNAYACRYQWITKEKGIWGHTLLSATK